MSRIPDKSVDMILCDLPYGTTACKWDAIIPFEPLWEQYERVLRLNGAIVLTASQPFTTQLIKSNMAGYSHQWIWKKNTLGNPLLANVQPMKNFEDVLVFHKGNYDLSDERREYFRKVLAYIGKSKTIIVRETNQGLDHCFRIDTFQFSIPTNNNYDLLIQKYGIDRMSGFMPYDDLLKTQPNRVYNPQKTKGESYKCKQGKLGEAFGESSGVITINHGDRYPTSIIEFNTDKEKLHPTQKPVALFEYLIKTYTNEGETVLDNCMGSGTTAIACINTNRNYIGFEKEEKYYNIIEERIKNHKPQLKLAI